MKKISKNTLSFPIVLKCVVDDLVLSVPDLGLFKNLPLRLEKNSDDPSKSSTVQISEGFKEGLAHEIVDLWSKIETHRNMKKWQPNPSTFKQSLQSSEEDFSLPDFVKKLNQFISVSENTIRREIQRGVIRCYQTEGGHRRIPVSELASYLARIETKRNAGESEV